MPNVINIQRLILTMTEEVLTPSQIVEIVNQSRLVEFPSWHMSFHANHTPVYCYYGL